MWWGRACDTTMLFTSNNMIGPTQVIITDRSQNRWLKTYSIALLTCSYMKRIKWNTCKNNGSSHCDYCSLAIPVKSSFVITISIIVLGMIQKNHRRVTNLVIHCKDNHMPIIMSGIVTSLNVLKGLTEHSGEMRWVKWNRVWLLKKCTFNFEKLVSIQLAIISPDFCFSSLPGWSTSGSFS